MRIKPILLAAGALIALLFTNCAKDSSGPEHHDEPEMTYLCDGNKSDLYYPIKDGNIWTMASTMGTNATATINGVKAFEGQTYNVMQYEGNAGKYDYYLRIEPNGDVYRYVSYSNSPEFSKEYLVIPGNPTVGTTWDYAPTLMEGGKLNRRVITSTTSSIKTSKCEYKNLIEIKEYNSDNDVVNTLYFMKGLGIVREANNIGSTDLIGVTLK
jgi:hypothetical protein